MLIIYVMFYAHNIKYPKTLLWVFIFSLILLCSGVPINVPGMPDHTDFTTIEKIEFDKYPAQTITVTTEDGYINTIHRIPAKVARSPVVMLQHGLLSSSAQWVMNIPRNNLAYILHENGYDVWMPNFRGNSYSRSHVSLDPNATSYVGNGFTGYWNFSYHEMGIYDLPTFIDTALNTAGVSKLSYVGHSMGTTTYFVMCSELPAYRDKIKHAVLAAPVAYTATTISPITVVARLIIPGITQEILEDLGPGEYLPSGTIINKMVTKVCADVTSLPCANLIFIQFGFDFLQLNQTLVPFYSSQMPAGASTKTVVHFAQGLNNGEFRNFDYGRSGNLMHYNSEDPPSYNLKNVNADMAFIWGLNDWLADPIDVAKLTAAVRPNYNNNPRNFQSCMVPWIEWNHGDYITAIGVNRLVYDLTVRLLANSQELMCAAPN